MRPPIPLTMTPRAPTSRRWIAGAVAFGTIAGLAAAFVVSRDPAGNEQHDPIAARPIDVALDDAAVATIPDATVVAAAPRDTGTPARPPSPRDARVPTSRPTQPSHVAHGAGELSIYVTPWAMIWIDGKPAGQTPFTEKLPAGKHAIRIANEDAGKNETLNVTITADQKTTIRRTW